MTDAQIYHEAVARGVEFLDRTLPGWRNTIDLQRLDMKNGCACILGQAYEHHLIEIGENDSDYPTDAYIRACREYGLTDDEEVDLGFQIYDHENEDSRPHDRADAWDALEDAWKLELAR